MNFAYPAEYVLRNGDTAKILSKRDKDGVHIYLGQIAESLITTYWDEFGNSYLDDRYDIMEFVRNEANYSHAQVNSPQCTDRKHSSCDCKNESVQSQKLKSKVDS